MSSTTEQNPAKGHLSVWDAVSIIIGIVIGSGIYETAPFILSQLPGPGAALAVWAVCGVLSLIGALCYSELASAYPRTGGDYVYLTRAYGPWAGFLFGWAQLAVIMTGSIGMMAFVFADYGVKLFNLQPADAAPLAIAAVIVVSGLNICGVVFGKRAQNFLTTLKIIGLGGIVIAGFGWAQPASAAPAAAGTGGANFGLAMILVLYTYGGWNDAAFVVAEMKDRKNIPRALLLGVGAVAVIYLLINAAYLLALGFDGAKSSRAIAADVLGKPLGDFGAKGMSILVMISALGALNGLIFTGSRIYSTVGQDFSLFATLSRWHPRLGSPVWSLSTQAVITLLMIFFVGTEAGRALVSQLFSLLGSGKIEWQGHGGFETLLRCTSPMFWLFFLATGISLFVLRKKEPATERPFRVPLFPITPLIFCATCGYMLYSAIDYAKHLTWIGVLPVGLGCFLYLLSKRTMVGVNPNPS
ncbi:MAG: amino acid permease [Verrucomicrobiota bacterium]